VKIHAELSVTLVNHQRPGSLSTVATGSSVYHEINVSRKWRYFHQWI